MPPDTVFLSHNPGLQTVLISADLPYAEHLKNIQQRQQHGRKRRAVLWQAFPLQGTWTFLLNSFCPHQRQQLSSPSACPPKKCTDVCCCTGKLQRSCPSRSYGTAQIVYIPRQNCADCNRRLRLLSDGRTPDICWLFCNILQTPFSTKPESGI